MAQTLDELTPAEFIALAEERGACQEGLDWMKAQNVSSVEDFFTLYAEGGGEASWGLWWLQEFGDRLPPRYRKIFVKRVAAERTAWAARTYAEGKFADLEEARELRKAFEGHVPDIEKELGL